MKNALLVIVVVSAVSLLTAVFLYFSDSPIVVNHLKDDSPTPHTLDLKEKVGQLIMIGHWSNTMTDTTTKAITDLHLGGVVVMDAPGDGGRIRGWSEVWRAAGSALPLLIAIDQEGGVVSRVTADTFPLTAQPAITSADSAYRTASERAQALFTLGINANFSPVLDRSVNPEAFMYERVFRDPESIASLGDAMIRGYQNNDIVAVPKHYPGHPDSADDSHLTLPILTLSPAAYREHTEQFAEVLQAGNVDIMMTAHVLVPEIDSRYPATLSPLIMEDLRKRIGYQGVVLTDDLAMQAISDQWSYEEAAVLALRAGADMIMLAAEPEVASSTIAAIISAVELGELSENRIDQAYSRVANLKQSLE